MHTEQTTAQTEVTHAELTASAVEQRPMPGLPITGENWHAQEQLATLEQVKAWKRRERFLTPAAEARRLEAIYQGLMTWDTNGDTDYLKVTLDAARELWALRLIGERPKTSRRTKRRRARKGATMAKKKAKKSKSKKSKKMSGY